MIFDEFLKYIRLGENPTGSYDTLFNNSQVQGKPFEGTNVSQMTLDQLYQFSDPKGPYGQYVKGINPEGKVATPMGYFQIVGDTLRDFAGQLNLPGDTVFNKDVQQQLARAIYDKQGQGAWPGAVKAMNREREANQGPAPLSAVKPGILSEGNQMQPNTQAQSRGGLLQSIFGGGGPRTMEDEQARLRRLQFAQSLNALVHPEMRIDNTAAIKSQEELINRNRSIEYLKQQAAAGDKLAQAALGGLQGGADIGAVMGAYLKSAMAGPDTSKLNSEMAGLRKEFTGLGTVKDFQDQTAALGRIIASAENPSAAGDLALIFNYMKMLDPGSTVREGEFANAQNAGGVGTRLISLYNNIRDGTRLTDDQRADFVGRATGLYTKASEDFAATRKTYTDIAEKLGYDIDIAVPNFGYTGELPVIPQNLPTLQVPPVPQNAIIKDKKSGTERPMTPREWAEIWDNKSDAERQHWLDNGVFP